MLRQITSNVMYNCSKKVFCMCGFLALLPIYSAAQPTGFSGSAASDLRTLVPSVAGGLLAPFKSFTPVDTEQPRSDTPPQRTATHQKIIDLSSTGDYQAAGDEGMRLMAREVVDDELQLIVANSLAWTGRLKDAVPVYQGLSKGKFATTANVGLANVNRWRGRDDLARPLYLEVLQRDPANTDAAAGLALANRELGPRTTISAGAASDSSDLKRQINTVNHRWRDASGTSIFEVEFSGFRDWLPQPSPEVTEQDLTLRYESLNLALKPSLELNMPTKLTSTLYGKAKLKFFDDQVTIGAGRVNWGKAVANPIASIDHLAANYLGAEVVHTSGEGRLLGQIDHYSISDGNTILTSNLLFTSNWRPLGKHIKPYIGAETRTGNFNTPNYWSPAEGYGSLYGGLMGEWDVSDLSLYSAVQLGAPLYGEAGNSWSFSAGSKHWLTHDIAFGLNLWAMASWRNNATYKAQTFNISLEKIWR